MFTELQLKVFYQMANYSQYPIVDLPKLPTLQDIIADELAEPVDKVAKAIDEIMIILGE